MTPTLPVIALGDHVAKCPTCQQPGVLHRRDDRGALIVHPGRPAYPCRVKYAPR